MGICVRALLGLSLFAMATAPPLPEHGMDCVTLGSSKTPKPPCEVQDSELRFAILGDWGGKATTAGDEKVNEHAANIIKTYAKNNGLHFVLNVGDNFYSYFKPTESVADQFKRVFHDVFPASEINLPFYGMLGNHDYVNFKGIQEQLAYTRTDPGKRWIMPERYYTMNFHLTRSNQRIKFIMVDTQLLCGTIVKVTKSVLPRPIGRELMTAAQLKESMDQEAWLLSEIEKGSSADHLFVVGHYHVHTIRTLNPAMHCMKEILSDKLLAGQRITVYISGHEHLLQHFEIRDGGNTVHHVLSGEGYNISPITKKDVDVYKRERASTAGLAEFFHGRLEDPATAPHATFKAPKNDAPGVVVVAAGANGAHFKYIDDATGESPLHSFSVPVRPTSPQHQGPALVATDPRKNFKPVYHGRCQAEWKAHLKNAQLIVTFNHESLGQLGCTKQADAPSIANSAVFKPGGNRMKLATAQAAPEGNVQPIWTCWRCVQYDIVGNQVDNLVPAFCHVGNDPRKDAGSLAYDRYINQDGYLYMCNGLQFRARNTYTPYVMFTPPAYHKADVQSEEDPSENAKANFYFMSEDLSYIKE